MALPCLQDRCCRYGWLTDFRTLSAGFILLVVGLLALRTAPESA